MVAKLTLAIHVHPAILMPRGIALRGRINPCGTLTISVELTPLPTIVHTNVSLVGSAIEVLMTVIEAVAAIVVPTVTASIGGIEVRPSEIEVVTVGITEIDAEVPITCLPVKWTIEILGCKIGAPLPVEKDITQVKVATLPISAEHIRTPRNTHEVVKVDLIRRLILGIRQIQLVCHLVRQDKGFPASLLVTHCTC